MYNDGIERVKYFKIFYNILQYHMKTIKIDKTL